MAHSGKLAEEKKSYAAVFLLGVGLLLIGGVWAILDDQISRRPWKKYQYEFSELQIQRAQEEVAAEEKRLAELPEYQQTEAQLKEERERIESGDTARTLAQLDGKEATLRVQRDDVELKLRVKKSELEEAWYEHEHARLTEGDVKGTRERVEELEAQRKEIESRLAEREAAWKQVVNEREEIRSVVEDLTKQKRDLEAELDLRRQKLDGLLIHAGPLDVPKIPKIQQIVMNEFDRNNFDQAIARVDRCQSCHAGINKAGFEEEAQPFATHPDRKFFLSKHPIERLGCTPCHQGQGAAVNSVEQAHGYVHHWLQPMFKGENVQASCIQCHADVRTDRSEKIALGEKLFEQVGCVGCHLVEGYGDVGRVGPYLRRISAKVDADWLVEWIRDPHKYRPRTKMPFFYFDEQQSRAIAGYILSSSQEESEGWLQAHPMPAGIDSGNAALVGRGRELVDSLGCRGCHGIEPNESPATLGNSKDIAPNLSNVAEKTNPRWLYHWLKDPRGYSPEARMPSLRLSDDEARAVASYLLTLGTRPSDDSATRQALLEPQNVARGEALVRKYGCPGCHNVAGMEAESRIGVELTVFGSKPKEELFFGERTDIPETWYDWTYNKVKTPRTYATERIEQVMPLFSLQDEEIEAILVFLASRVDTKIAEQYRPSDLEHEKLLVAGRRVVERYNCVGCHVIEGRGGAIRARYEENPTLGPPTLNGEGAKLQPNWFFGFLKRPVPVRPWLKVRMPTFGMSDAEAQTIVKYFFAQDRVKNPFVYVDQKALDPAMVAAGHDLASPDYLNCFSCHQQGDRKPEGPQEGWAPDLAMAAERLNPDWIVEWIRDPQALQPGTRMPSFYDFSDPAPDGPEDILEGNDGKQVEALRDYILTLHGAPTAAMAAAPVPAAAPEPPAPAAALPGPAAAAEGLGTADQS
jgi:mono/diheme cytochrome c family protein